MAPLGTVLVTAPTGRVGRAALAVLAQSGKFTVRAAARNEDSFEYLKSLGADECVKYDLKDPSTWGPATDGVSRIFSSSMDSLIQEHMDFAKFLGEKKDIKHVVRISCFGADTNTNDYDLKTHASLKDTEIPLMLQHYWWSEECLIKAGLPTTGIRGNFYMNHLLKNEVENIKNGFFCSPLGDCKNSFVSPCDQGEAAALCLIEGPEKHADKFYDITGAEPQSMHEVASTLSEVWGQKVEYRPQDIVQFEKDFGPTRRAFFEYLRNGFYTRCAPDFFNLTGRKPVTYKEYLTQKGPHGGTGLEELFSATGSIYTKGVDQFAGLANVKKDGDAKKSGSNSPPALKARSTPPSLQEHSLYEPMLKRGAFFKPEMPTTDMQYPVWFDPDGKNLKWDPKEVHDQEWRDHVMAEMANTASNAGIIHDVYSKIFITGPKAKEFLSKITTCVLAKTVGDVRMGYVCRADGQLMNEATIATRGENDYYYCGQLGHGKYEMDLLLPLRDELGYTAEDVDIENASQHFELIHVAGPKCTELLAEVMGQEAVDTPVFKFRNLTIDGIPLECFRMSFTGMVGYEFHVPTEHAAAIYNKICDHPASVKAGLKPHGLFAVAGLRIEQFYRISADVKDIAHYKEMSVDRFMSQKKRAESLFHGCDESFVPQKEFLYLVVDTPKGYEWTLTFSPQSPIFLNGEQVGHTTSSAVGGQSLRTHACALMYKRDISGDLVIEAHGQKFPAKVLKEPLVRYSGRD